MIYQDKNKNMTEQQFDKIVELLKSILIQVKKK